MERQSLEQTLGYAHQRFSRFLGSADEPHVAGENVVALGTNRIVYFWLTNASGKLLGVLVPGIIKMERYRTDAHGNTYSAVLPVAEELKPSLERTVWFELTKTFGVVLPERIMFGYWSYSDSPDSDAAQSPQQRE